MNNSYTTNSSRQPANLYRICIQGALDQRWTDSLGGMSISTDQNAGTETVTTLFGQLPDQAALFGFLNFLYELRCSLLLVERVNAQSALFLGASVTILSALQASVPLLLVRLLNVLVGPVWYRSLF